MGDVVWIGSARKRKEGSPSKDASNRFKRDKLAEALAEFGSLAGSKTLKRKTEWLKKEKEDEYDIIDPFTD